jgi:uncharacterized protein (TIGR00730 family)
MELRRVCVLCGSSSGVDASHQELARSFGKLLADRSLELVYGGAQVGLMGEVANASLAAGGRVTGVIPQGLFAREVPHHGLTTLHEVGTMHERKALMYDLADGFVALPGGLGTLDELAEVSTWSSIGLHSKPIVLLDADGFWDPLVAMLDRMVDKGFVAPPVRRSIQRGASPEEALTRLTTAQPLETPAWITPSDR